MLFLTRVSFKMRNACLPSDNPVATLWLIHNIHTVQIYILLSVVYKQKYIQTSVCLMLQQEALSEGTTGEKRSFPGQTEVKQSSASSVHVCVCVCGCVH